MNLKTQIQKLLQELLLTKTVDEKRYLGNQIIKLFKQAEFVSNTPVAIRLNTSLQLKEILDNFTINDNSTNREALKNVFNLIEPLIANDLAA